MVDLVERLDVLLKQECVSEDYLAPSFQQKLQADFSEMNDTYSYSACSSSTSTSGINEVWREKICEWSYQVIDHFDFSREVVSISIHFLDRYLSTRPVNKKFFQMAAMTTLYLAIKLYEPGTLSMKSMIDLSRGYFSVDQMAEMELSILRSLSWKMHPPTAYCFAKHILFLLPYSSITMEARYDTLELARFLTELSVIDYFFVVHRPSVVALAALLNAIEATPGASEGALLDLANELKRNPGLDPNRPEVVECRNRLQVLYSQGGYTRPEVLCCENRDETISPVCVTQGVTQDTAFTRGSIDDTDRVFEFSDVAIR